MAKNSSAAKVTSATAAPQNDVELRESVATMANALKGTYATGTFDGGIGASGLYHRYAEFWDAKLVTTVTGSTTITFPFTLVDSLVYQNSISDTGEVTEKAYHVDNSKTLSLVLTGVKNIIEVAMVHNTREAQ